MCLQVTLLGLCVSVWKLSAALVEIRYLKETLRRVVPGGRIRDRSDLVRLKNYLSQQIRFDDGRKDEARPILRAGAAKILERRYGFCGENARTATWLLYLGGVRANRLYLEGERWGHTVVEHVWKGQWVLFDAHADQVTLLPDDDVGRIESSRLGDFPADAKWNPWCISYRNKVCHLARPLRPLENLRLPQWLVLTLESPSLTIAAATVSLTLVVGAFLCWS